MMHAMQSIVRLVALLFVKLIMASHPPSVLVAEPVSSAGAGNLPLIVTTWAAPCFQAATEQAWQKLQGSGSRVAAVVAGCSSAESSQCDTSVGYGNHPDETGETTLDALIMDGPEHRMGAVGNLRQVKNAIGVAAHVMNYTKHSFLAGESASRFAQEMGFPLEDLHTKQSWQTFQKWLNNSCQPNFRKNVSPDASKHCGPYTPNKITNDGNKHLRKKRSISGDHDTIGLLVVDQNGDIACGTSTNGANGKIAGRVGDSPMAGAGAYLDNNIGAAAGTGDGDVMLRTLPTYQAVENMRQGMSPDAAAQDAIQRIVDKHDQFEGALVTLHKSGTHGSACHGLDTFTYSYRTSLTDRVQTRTVQCTKTKQ